VLVIRRRAGEAITIGGSVEVEVIEISGARVKLGIRAAPEVIILRKELIPTGRQNQRAAESFAQTLAGEGLEGVLRALGRLPDRD
jgi:carbon storage regulator